MNKNTAITLGIVAVAGLAAFMIYKNMRQANVPTQTTTQGNTQNTTTKSTGTVADTINASVGAFHELADTLGF